ncbi:Molybdopterin-guanine dinucleotide biosynthesis protein MobB [hydrothermal vent metagenome]|uniref:Molybdopterin-guanine dinucleotide biosynthesis protein MobB n=1 Tax=hydrothermal vent metagenome TaxID=652676 RepID=A0A3B1AH95_9ZZZZ
MKNIKCPVVGFVAYSGTGKTTLLKKVIAILNSKNINLAVLKHAHHDFDIDIPGKDSYELRHAGASQILVASKNRWALITETLSEQTEPNLAILLQQLNHAELDLILVEGFKHEVFDKIELHRPSLGKATLFTKDSNIIAVASDKTESLKSSLPLLDINNATSITDFIIKNYDLD